MSQQTLVGTPDPEPWPRRTPFVTFSASTGAASGVVTVRLSLAAGQWQITESGGLVRLSPGSEQ